jgi:hypothetical protein
MLLEITVISKIHHATQLWLTDIIGINSFFLPTIKHVICRFQEFPYAMIPKRPLLLCRSIQEA